MWPYWWRRLPLVGVLVSVFLIFLASHGLVVALSVTLLILATYVVRHLWQLAQLDRWLRNPGGPAPSGVGEWGDVFYLLNKHLRSSRHGQDIATAGLEQMLQATRSLPDGVVILDKRDRIAWLNDAAERYLGLSRTRDIGQFIYYLLRNARFVEWLAMDDHGQSLRMRAPILPEVTLSLQLVRMSLDQRMLLAHDVTELERVDAMRRDFIANVSHELRTPVTVIAGFLETFDEMERPDPGALKKHFRLMREQSDRIRHLLDDLLVLAKLEGEQDMKNETVDVPGMVEVLAGEARSLSQGQHEIAVEIATRMKLIGSSQELRSAFGNLVSNAVRYTPAGGRITLRWRLAESGNAEFSVVDTGEGIDAKHIPRLTERFYRVDRGRSRASGGTGLGLAIVKHVLQRHQGKLKVDSAVGKGSTFTASLPADRVIPETVPDAEPAPRSAVA
ncbi:phosphate regulon sensor histidine kinase PhoR [Parasulfuritortus cantonensis]|uniref:Phosphate regulon sensor protein PhoR n=1 Tax=Parasulfuritortus cantonensis TaxID=2528202 RepID=A0A4V2NWE8_9PROT|nr:phosphate regulon sensor histidine kinase PhoR [Parasulfuritortus cantonensis]TCJ17162.1 phosphate regulon sensor histidine kinase PhoR [Parasulfuritortus cantonensis]